MPGLGRLSFCIGTLVSILILGNFVAAQDSSVRKELEALYAKRDQAFKSRDAGFVKSLLAEDYTSKDPDGRVKNRADAAKETDEIFASPVEVTSFVTKVESVKHSKDRNEAIVETAMAARSTFVLDGQTHRSKAKAKFRDTWVRTGAGWKVKHSEALGATLTEEAATWIKYTSPEGRYSVLFPGQPTLETEQPSSAKPRTYSAGLLSIRGDGIAKYDIAYFDLTPNQNLSLDDLRADEIKRLAGKGTLASDKPISLNGYPGRQLVTLPKEGGEVTISRVYKAGDRAYIVAFGYTTAGESKNTPDESKALKGGGAKFFDSFQIRKKP